MTDVLTKKDMQALDRHMIDNVHIPSRILMENAAFGMTTAICASFSTDTPIAVVCGTGNNGGDGFAAARQLMAKGYDVRVFLVGQTSQLKNDAADNAAFFGDSIIEITDADMVLTHLSDMHGWVVIDAVFGVGLSRNVTGLYAGVIDTINKSGAYIVACDIPSGIHADTGAVLGTAAQADETVTFQCTKPGHFLYPGRAHTGTLTVKEIGVARRFDTGRMRAYADGLYFDKRAANTHKGSYGKLACVVASQGFTGAGLMCVGAALRAGAGLVTAGIPSTLQPVFSSVPQAMTFALSDFGGALSDDCIDGIARLADGKTALAAGPGLGTGSGVKKAVSYMVRNGDIKKVFDADALNVIAQNTDILLDKKGDIILTPHLGEFSRLCGKDMDTIKADLLGTTMGFAKQYGVTLLLKGATTIVTNGEHTVFVLTGTPGMARGGSGDVLTGVIGGLLCGGRAGGMDGFTAALYGAYICGKAGEAAARACGEMAMTAMDTLAHIAQATQNMTI